MIQRYVDAHDVFIKLLQETGKSTVTSAEIRELCEKNGMKIPQWFMKDESNKLDRGTFRVPGSTSIEVQETQPVTEEREVSPMVPTNTLSIQTITTMLERQCIVPDKYKNYVPFGNFDDLKAIIHSRRFYPVFITGESGNGKTMSAEQACAQLGREYICYSMNPETDETDLLGGYVLINGQMIWIDGAVTIAAKRGAVLCLDEIDYGAQNLSTLQRVLEGKPFLLKKKGEIVHPIDGFQIIATANTKGKGSENGRYMFTNILNEAFLDRFPITFEQDWAPAAVEKKIVKRELEFAGRPDDEFANHLIVWATTIRKTYSEEGTSEVISTRRLVHIAKAYPIFGDRLKAITYCLNRFDGDVKRSFIDLYSKIDASVVLPNTVNVAGTEEQSATPV